MVNLIDIELVQLNKFEVISRSKDNIMASNIDECEAAGLDTKDVDRICKGLERYAKQAQALGLTIFGGSGSGSLRFHDNTGRSLIVGIIYNGLFDGGDGSTRMGDDGLERSE